jgi:hypothetical protein
MEKRREAMLKMPELIKEWKKVCFGAPYTRSQGSSLTRL